MPASRLPRLIVNADDFGWNRHATDRTIEAFAAGRITSTTAMVHMEDSDRAATLGQEAGLPTGLHLNLTDPYTAPSLPEDVRERHLRLCRHFSRDGFRLLTWAYDPRIRHGMAAVIGDQLQGFRDLYGTSPTHVDGHKHIHSCPNVALSAPLAGMRMRNGLRAAPSARTAMGAMRAARRALTYRGKLTTRYFFDIAELFREMTEEEIAARVGLAGETSVEIMAHPGFAHEREALNSPLWAELLESAPRGGYGDLH
jgi:chitin disaccharide deacetylase